MNRADGRCQDNESMCAHMKYELKVEIWRDFMRYWNNCRIRSTND